MVGSLSLLRPQQPVTCGPIAMLFFFLLSFLTVLRVTRLAGVNATLQDSLNLLVDVVTALWFLNCGSVHGDWLCQCRRH